MALKELKKPFEKQLPLILILGLLWGLMEYFIGDLLKIYFRPFLGLIMPLITAFFILTVKYFIPQRGSIILTAIVCALIIFFTRGMILHGTFMAVLLEAALIEIVFLIFKFKIAFYLISAVAIQLYSLIHPLISRGLFCLSTHFLAFKNWFNANLASVSTDILIIVLILFHIGFGLVAGFLAYKTTVYLAKSKLIDVTNY